MDFEKYSCTNWLTFGQYLFYESIHAISELGVQDVTLPYTVVKVGGGIGQDLATEVTHLGLISFQFFPV